MAEEKVNPEGTSLVKEIDIMGLITQLWLQRRRLIKWGLWGAVIGIVIAFSIPKQYTTRVKLAPEVGENYINTGGGLGALMAMVGGSASDFSSNDAVYPLLYPDVVSSIPFLTDLFDMEVKTAKGEEMTLEEYVRTKTRYPWWSYVINFPFKIIGKVMSSAPAEGKAGEEHVLDPFHLTKKELGLVAALRQDIVCTVDVKTSIVSIEVTMQDPVVSAMVADKVINHLQEYVTVYRTNKSRKDLLYAQKLNKEAREEYYAAQQRYADYIDSNQGLANRSAQTVSERLENEAQLAFDLYNQTARQEQIAQAKVQENTPVFAVVHPASVPSGASAPPKMMIIVGFAIMAFLICAVWITFGTSLYDDYRTKKKEHQQGDASGAKKKE
ncbi:MAG: chain-length determining protein [Muribaculaceae bacterium]|nr:chain-length determining protein [Muribaculaceae bacterium]